MTADVTARAFEPFFTTKPPGQGSGLGLSTVHAIASRAGGSVELESEPGVGTVVSVYLPAPTERAASQESTQAPASRPRPAGAGATRTVLVVDDEDALRTVASRILTKAGYRVLEAGRPSEALTICQTEHGVIDVLLTDVVMPEMSGPELARRVTELRPEIRVLFMSGYPADFVARKHIPLDLQPLMEKPFTEPVLLAALARLLESSPGSDPGESPAS